VSAVEAGDFSIQSQGTTCGTSLVAGATCSFAITFSPKAPSTVPTTRTGTLTVIDNAGGTPGSTQTVPLSGNVDTTTP